MDHLVNFKLEREKKIKFYVKNLFENLNVYPGSPVAIHLPTLKWGKNANNGTFAGLACSRGGGEELVRWAVGG